MQMDVYMLLSLRYQEQCNNYGGYSLLLIPEIDIYNSNQLWSYTISVNLSELK